MGNARVLAAVGTLVVAVAAQSALAAPLCDPEAPLIADRQPMADDCCSAYEDDPEFECPGVVEGLKGGRKNVLLILSDDHGYCTNGYMAGRCARAQPGERCAGKRCSNASWVSCNLPTDCPIFGCGDVTCEPPAGECPCRNGFCEQQAGECADGDILVDGLCSPRMPCGDGGQFVCARGRCVPIDPADPGQGRHCLGRPHTDTCTNDRDCDDTCGTDGLCLRTPKPCAVNGDCAEPGREYVCAASEFPLRLNDISCAYRRRSSGTDVEWKHSLASNSAGTPPLTTTMHTPNLDRLAAEGAVFPRARSGAQSCQPARSAVLIGRPARHRTVTLKEQDPGQCRMADEYTFDEPALCMADADCSGLYPPGHCDPYHSIAFWLDADHHIPGGSGTSKAAHTIAVGKVEAAGISDTFDDDTLVGLEGPGTFDCPVGTSGTSCGERYRQGMIPAAAIGGQQGLVGRLRALVGEDGGDPSGTGVPRLPFFAFYGPELPHDAQNGCKNLTPSANHAFFIDLYGPPVCDAGPHPSEAQMAGTTYLDAGVGALVDELKRTCVCGPDASSATPDETPRWSSLWDHTVVVFMADHGTLLPRAKNAGVATENGQRTPMIVRVPGESPRVMSEAQAAGFYDVLPTVIDYTNGFTSGEGDALDRYPINHSLRETVENENPPSLRPIYYGSHARDTVPGTDDLRRYLIPRPGLLGVCSAGTIGTLCMPSETTCPSGGICVPQGRMCVNTRKICGSPADCAVGVCKPSTQSTQCAIPGQPAGTGTCCIGGSFRDFGATTSCVGDADCAPPGACHPPLVKVMKDGNPPGTVRIAELNSNPDEGGIGNSDNSEPLEEDLAATTFLPTALRTELIACLDEYWALVSSTGVDNRVWRPATTTTTISSSSVCRSAWRPGPRCPAAGACPPFP